MKTFSLFFLIILLPLHFAFAQSEFGVKGGLNLSDIQFLNKPASFDNYNDTRFRYSYHAGVFGNFNLIKKLSLGTDILFSSKGFRSEATVNNETIKSRQSFNYISLPVMVKYEIIPNLKFGIGGEVSYMLYSKRKNNDIKFNSDNTYDSNLDLGLVAGLEYSLLKSFKLGARYIHGLSNVFGEKFRYTDEFGNPTEKNGQMQNRTFQIYVGYVLKK